MKSILLLVAAICVAISFAEFEEHQTIFLRDGVPQNSGYSILRKAESAHKVKFTISLQQRNLDQLEARFWANADPNSPVFAQHMTRAEVMALIAPTMKTQKSVLRWIHSVADSLPKGNVFEVDNQQDAIVVTSTALFAEKLFRTEMFLFFNERNNIISCKHIGQLSIPASLKSSITFVSGITELEPVSEPKEDRQGKPFVSEKAKAARQTADNQCNTAYTIKNLYNVPQNLYVTQKGANSSIYAEPQAGMQDGFGLGSIEDYQNANGVPKDPITCILGTGAQYYITNDTDTEANLDTEMMTGMAPSVDACFYLMEPGNGWMYEFSRYIFNTPEAPLVVSMSYGWNEVDSCDNLTIGYTFLGNCTYYHIPDSQTYVNLTNVNFMKLGLVGHTLLAAAGDDGIAGTHQSLNNCETQGPIFPAASPFVTTVGATSVEVSASPKPSQKRAGEPPICSDTFYQCVCSTSNNEQVAEGNNTAEFDTGGGFSMYSPQPAYQNAAVQAYLKSGVVLPPKQYFNGNNRGFPDIAAVGENICLLNPGQPCEPVGGTSASTPIIAALITLLNNDRLAAGKTPLGFFNPIIYQMFAADSDKYFNNKFEYGNNAGECPSDMGFNTKSGFWTPLTGCGSPNFETIRTYVAQLK